MEDEAYKTLNQMLGFRTGRADEDRVSPVDAPENGFLGGEFLRITLPPFFLKHKNLSDFEMLQLFCFSHQQPFP
jgi:hypothetical protein